MVNIKNRIVRELFEPDFSDYTYDERESLVYRALKTGRRELKSLSRGQKRYGVIEGLSKREGLDGKQSQYGEFLDGDVHRDRYRKPEVLTHEKMHRVARKYDTPTRIHSEDLIHWLTEKVLGSYLHDHDSGVREQARRGYTALAHRFVGNIIPMDRYRTSGRQKKVA